MSKELASKMAMSDLSGLSSADRMYIQDVASMNSGHTPGITENLEEIGKKLKKSKGDFRKKDKSSDE